MLDAYSIGICTASICTDIKDRKEIERVMNVENPTGIQSDWIISEDTHFLQGMSNPTVCEKQGKPFMHYLMEC